jgi:four helix bundle protein
MTGFRDLKVWQRSKALAVGIYKLTDENAITRDFSLKDQIRRAAVSVCSNIAEGDERYSDKEAVRFFYMAKGSLAELATQLEIADEVGLCTSGSVLPFLTEIDEVGNMLGGLIRARKE